MSKTINNRAIPRDQRERGTTPTPAEIMAAAAEIRKTWDANVERLRCVTKPQSVETPEVRVVMD